MDAGSGFMSTNSNNGAGVPKLVNTTPSASINFEPVTSTRSNGSSVGTKKKAADFYFKKQTSTVQKNLAVKTDFMTQEIRQAPQTARNSYGNDLSKSSKSPMRKNLTSKGQPQHYIKANISGNKSPTPKSPMARKSVGDGTSPSQRKERVSRAQRVEVVQSTMQVQ